MADIVTGIRVIDRTREGMRRAAESVRRGTDRMRDAFDRTENAAEETSKAVTRIGQAGQTAGSFLKEALSSGIGDLFSGGVQSAIGSALSFANSALEAADELQALSDRVGVSAEVLQEWQYIAVATGSDADDVADAFREMQLRLSEAAQLGSGPAVDALNLLGLTLQDLEGLDPARQFELLRNAISEVEDPADRLFLAEELLGGATERLGGLIEGTAEEMAGLRQEARDTGQVMSDETVASLDQAHESFSNLTTQVKNFAVEALVNFAEGLRLIPERVPDVLKALDSIESEIRDIEAITTLNSEAQDISIRQYQRLYEILELTLPEFEWEGSLLEGLEDAYGSLSLAIEEAQRIRQEYLDQQTLISEIVEAYETQLHDLFDVTEEVSTATSELTMVTGEEADALAATHSQLSSNVTSLDLVTSATNTYTAAIRENIADAHRQAQALYQITVQADQAADAHEGLRRAAAVGRIGGSGELVYTGRTQRRRTAPGGGGGGGGGRSAREREERPPPVRLGDYLFNEGLFDQEDVNLLRRFGRRDQFGAFQAVNLGQNIAGLNPDELDQLVERVLNERSRARRRDAQARREEREEEARKKQEEELKRIGDGVDKIRAAPCPPVTVQGSVVTERDLESVIVDIQQQVAPGEETRNPISGVRGI